MKMTMNDYAVFWDNGSRVAVRTADDGVRRNIALCNCRTKREATEAAREDRDFLNAREVSDD